MLKQQISLIVLVCILLQFNVKKCMSTCYFPPELQGSYLTQNTITENHVQYSEVNITGDSIPIWGSCHKRVGNNFILRSDEEGCFRCFHLKLVAKNILRVITVEPDFLSKCYINENKATCPSSSSEDDEILINFFNYSKIIHYKIFDFEGIPIRYEYCPINGRYKFNYNNNDDSKEDDVFECLKKTSEVDNCPSGSIINLRFKECSFENHELRFECLGHWTDLDGKNYLALVNNIPSTDYNSYYRNKREIFKPQYRCGIFEEDPITGNVIIQFSKDSTCSVLNTPKNYIINVLPNNNTDYTIINNHNSNPIGKYSNSETLLLYPINQTLLWPNVKFCNFPQLLQGEWQHITIKYDTFIYRDPISFKAYTMKCIEKNIDDTILVYSRTQCDEESYKCLKIKQRNKNVVEFQIGSKSSHEYDQSLCSDEHFDDNRWLTQGYLNATYSSCPINGILEGLIPDALNLCAKLSSDCNSDDRMHYEVSDCNENVLEEREYLCLGQWTENDHVFTYTKRLDIGTYECFIGGMKNNEKIFIKEAGEHCQRNTDPFKYGMELKQIEKCSPLSISHHHHHHHHDHHDYDESPPLPPLSATETTTDNFKIPTFVSRIKTATLEPIAAIIPSTPTTLLTLGTKEKLLKSLMKSAPINDVLSEQSDQQQQQYNNQPNRVMTQTSYFSLNNDNNEHNYKKFMPSSSSPSTPIIFVTTTTTAIEKETEPIRNSSNTNKINSRVSEIKSTSSASPPPTISVLLNVLKCFTVVLSYFILL